MEIASHEIIFSFELVWACDAAGPQRRQARYIGQLTHATCQSGRFAPSMMFATFSAPPEVACEMDFDDDVNYVGANLIYKREEKVLVDKLNT